MSGETTTWHARLSFGDASIALKNEPDYVIYRTSIYLMKSLGYIFTNAKVVFLLGYQDFTLRSQMW